MVSAHNITYFCLFHFITDFQKLIAWDVSKLGRLNQAIYPNLFYLHVSFGVIDRSIIWLIAAQKMKLLISSVNVIKFAGNYRFDHIYFY